MIRTPDALSDAEQRCCHMSHVVFDHRPDAVWLWRAEFAAFARSEKCRDCPAAKSGAT